MSEARVFEGVAPDIKVTERYAEENYRGFIIECNKLENGWVYCQITGKGRGIDYDPPIIWYARARTKEEAMHALKKEIRGARLF